MAAGKNPGNTWSENWALTTGDRKETSKQRLAGNIRQNSPDAEFLNKDHDYSWLLGMMKDYGDNPSNITIYRTIMDTVKNAQKAGDYQTISDTAGSVASMIRKAFGDNALEIVANPNTRVGYDFKWNSKEAESSPLGRALQSMRHGGGYWGEWAWFEKSPLAEAGKQRKDAVYDYFKRSGLEGVGTPTFDKTIRREIEKTGNVQDIGYATGKLMAQARLVKTLGNEEQYNNLMKIVNDLKEQYGDTSDFRATFNGGYNEQYLELSKDKIFTGIQSVDDDIAAARNNINKNRNVKRALERYHAAKDRQAEESTTDEEKKIKLYEDKKKRDASHLNTQVVY